MIKNELSAMLTFYAVSPIHAGSGASISAIDLPIQRERHTNWPHVQASAVKGALRSHFRCYAGDDAQYINLVFGSDGDNDKDAEGNKDLPGAISVSDARLFAFPVRSNISPFVWVTCPAVLNRLERDLQFLGNGEKGLAKGTELQGDTAISISPFQGPADKKVLLEDAVIEIKNQMESPLPSSLFPELERLILISDELYNYLVGNCTEIQTHIKIDSSTGTAQDGALRYQELLPSDSVLYSIVYFSASAMPSDDREIKQLQVKEVKNSVIKAIEGFIQMGGDQTLGRGICKTSWHEGGQP